MTNYLVDMDKWTWPQRIHQQDKQIQYSDGGDNYKSTLTSRNQGGRNRDLLWSGMSCLRLSDKSPGLSLNGENWISFKTQLHAKRHCVFWMEEKYQGSGRGACEIQPFEQSVPNNDKFLVLGVAPNCHRVLVKRFYWERLEFTVRHCQWKT